MTSDSGDSSDVRTNCELASALRGGARRQRSARTSKRSRYGYCLPVVVVRCHTLRLDPRFDPRILRLQIPRQTVGVRAQSHMSLTGHARQPSCQSANLPFPSFGTEGQSMLHRPHQSTPSAPHHQLAPRSSRQSSQLEQSTLTAKRSPSVELVWTCGAVQCPTPAFHPKDY